MRFINSLASKIVSFLFSLIGLQALLSCNDEGIISTETFEYAMYGMPPNYGYISGTVYGSSNTPLENVEIYAKSGNYEPEFTFSNEYIYKTDASGKFYIDLYKNGEYVFTFKDGDGEKNGSYKDQDFTVNYKEGESQTGKKITMEIQGNKK